MELPMDEERKVAIITGASRGIGEALVKAYRGRNYRVIANARSIEPSSDPDILAVAGDIGDPETAEKIVLQALDRYGRIDTLVNNAGIFIGKPFIEYSDDDYARILAINLNGFFHTTRRATAAMLKRGGGHIVQITSSLDENRQQPGAVSLGGSDQGWSERSDEVACRRTCKPGNPRQCGRARSNQDVDAQA
jgi:NAD(P)-dependent dehydrogenase (short-subunit alcohol dehydrogenase family)